MTIEVFDYEALEPYLLIVQGNAKRLDFHCTDQDGVDVDITGAVTHLTLKYNFWDSALMKIAEIDGVIDTAAEGKGHFIIPNDTFDLFPPFIRQVFWEAELELGAYRKSNSGLLSVQPKVI